MTIQTEGVGVGVPAASRGNRLRLLLRRSDAVRGYSLLSPTLIFLAAGILIPSVILIVMSFWTQVGFDFDTTVTTENYKKAIESPMVRTLLLRSLAISGWCTLATIVLSYPMAYYVAFHVHRRKMMWIILMTLPFWTSYLLRVFAWKIILGYNGVINSALISMGLIDQPLTFFLYSKTAVIITLTHAWAAFAILPMYVSLEKIDRSLLEAATDLGDGPAARFFRVTLPLSLPGVIAAMFMIFIPTVGDYITPALLGGPNSMMIGNLVQRMFGRINDWPLGATLAIIMVITVSLSALVCLFVTRKVSERIT